MGAFRLVSGNSNSWNESQARRPDDKARRGSKLGICDREATPPVGMPRLGIVSRSTVTGH